MIVTRAYRQLHAEIEQLHDLVTGSSALPEDFERTLVDVVDRLDELTYFCEGPEKVTTLMDTDAMALEAVVSRLEAEPGLWEAVEVLRELAAYPSVSALFDRQVQDFIEDITFGDTYGFDGVEPIGLALMEEHLRGLEMVHEQEMTPSAFMALKGFLASFEAYMYSSGLRNNPFDADAITDHLVRLTRIVGGF